MLLAKKLFQLLVEDVEPRHHRRDSNESWEESLEEIASSLLADNVHYDPRARTVLSAWGERGENVLVN